MLKLHLSIFKEPRGFMKVLQFLFAMLAFSTTVGFSTYFTFHATVRDCEPATGNSIRNNVQYPFALDSSVVRQTLCTNPAVTETFHFATDVSAAAKFFVAIGVVCMLYALVAAVGYVLLNDLYTSKKLLPTTDFVLHASLALLWLIASSAWADGVVSLKQACDPRGWLVELCRDKANVDCTYLPDDFSGSFAKLNVSLIFGFLNVFLWAANLWFLWKETPWYRTRPETTSAPAGGASSSAPRA